MALLADINIGKRLGATQQNAALVEQSAAASTALREQADKLAQVVGVFKVAGGEAPVQPARPTIHARHARRDAIPALT